jgi:sugar diacid utilization regulator
VAETLEDVPASRRMADLVLDALPADGSGPRVASIEEMRSRVILRELADRGALNLAVPGDPVRQIREHDGKHGTNYEQSLLAYLDAFGEAPRAAKALSIHENTLRYRLRRIESMFNLRLDDPDTRLLTWLQLRLSVAGGLTGQQAAQAVIAQSDAG